MVCRRGTMMGLTLRTELPEPPRTERLQFPVKGAEPRAAGLTAAQSRGTVSQITFAHQPDPPGTSSWTPLRGDSHSKAQRALSVPGRSRQLPEGVADLFAPSSNWMASVAASPRAKRAAELSPRVRWGSPNTDAVTLKGPASPKGRAKSLQPWTHGETSVSLGTSMNLGAALQTRSPIGRDFRHSATIASMASQPVAPLSPKDSVCTPSSSSIRVEPKTTLRPVNSLRTQVERSSGLWRDLPVQTPWGPMESVLNPGTALSAVHRIPLHLAGEEDSGPLSADGGSSFDPSWARQVYLKKVSTTGIGGSSAGTKSFQLPAESAPFATDSQPVERPQLARANSLSETQKLLKAASKAAALGAAGVRKGTTVFFEPEQDQSPIAWPEGEGRSQGSKARAASAGPTGPPAEESFGFGLGVGDREVPPAGAYYKTGPVAAKKERDALTPRARGAGKAEAAPPPPLEPTWAVDLADRMPTASAARRFQPPSRLLDNGAAAAAEAKKYLATPPGTGRARTARTLSRERFAAKPQWRR